MLVLSRADIEKILNPLDVIEAMAAAFRVYAAGGCDVPPRTVAPVGSKGVLLTMPGVSGDGPASGLGTKLVSVYPGNPARGHPTVYATYVLMDGATGPRSSPGACPR